LEALVSMGWQVDDTITTTEGPNQLANNERETNKLVLNAARRLVERLRYEGVGKPLGLGAVIVSQRLHFDSGKTSRVNEASH
jgi:charged multivesicular body protein 7